MPVIIKVGVSRKLTRNYNSAGYTLDVQTELPANAVQDPESMARATDELFSLAEDLINAQLARSGNSEAQAAPEPGPRKQLPYRQDAPRQGNGYTYRRGGNGNGNGAADRNGGPSRSNGGNGNGHGNTNGAGNGNGHAAPRAITDAQARALENMAKALDMTADQVAMDGFGVAVQGLNVRQASQLIDQLRGQIEAGNPQGGRR